MRRLIVTALVVPVLVLMLAGQAMAVISPGVEKTLIVSNDTCDSTGCTRTITGGWIYTDGTAEVRASQSFTDTNDIAQWQYFGITPVALNWFSYDSRGFIIGFPATSVYQEENLLPGNPVLPPRTVTMSASTRTSGKVTTNTNRTTDTDGTCSYKITQKSQDVAVVGTLTQDSTTLDANQQYHTFITEWTVVQRCPH